MPHRSRAVLFDAGFTLLEPVRPVGEVYLASAAELGVELEGEAFGAHLETSWQRLAGIRSPDPDLRTDEDAERAGWERFTQEVAAPFPALVARHAEWHATLMRIFDSPDHWRPLDGAQTVLEALAASGRRLAVVSNWHRALHGILAAHGLADAFDAILVSAEVGWRKPHRRIFEAALERCGVRAEEAVHVGDTPHDDVQGAHAAGIRAILIGAREPPEDLPPGTRRIRALRELLSGS